MILDAGVVRIWRRPPDMGGIAKPEDKELTLIYESYFGDLTVGMQRHWLARQANSAIDREIRIIAPPDYELIRMDDIATIGDHRYIINQAQRRRDEDAGADVCDLSLKRVNEKYDR